MTVTQLRHNGDGIQPCIFRQRRRDHFERLRKSLETVCLQALERLRMLCQHARHMHFRRTTTCDQSAFLH